MISTVSALYVDPRGIYPSLVADCWDAERNAKLYDGPNPVVAHPPCGPWSSLRFMCTKQDPECGPRAIAQVREWGGVLEHPKGSTLFRHCGVPHPGELADRWGGFTVFVNQVAWGHPCAKPTWLYCVGLSRYEVERGIRTGGVPTHIVTRGPRCADLPVAHSRMKSASPRLFAEWLVSLAATVPARRAA